MKLVETINMQKRELETENEELKSRMSEMLNERSNTMANVMENANTAISAQHSRPGIPLLNFNSGGV